MKGRWGWYAFNNDTVNRFIGLETCKCWPNLKIRIYSQILYVSLSLNLLTFVLPKTNHISHVTNHLYCTLPIRKSYKSCKNYFLVKITRYTLTHSTTTLIITLDIPIITFSKRNNLTFVSLWNIFEKFQLWNFFRKKFETFIHLPKHASVNLSRSIAIVPRKKILLARKNCRKIRKKRKRETRKK